MKTIISTQHKLILESNMKRRAIKVFIFILVYIAALVGLYYALPADGKIPPNTFTNFVSSVLNIDFTSYFSLFAAALTLFGIYYILTTLLSNRYKLEFNKNSKQIVLNKRGMFFNQNKIINFDDILDVYVKKGLFYKDNEMYSLNLSSRRHYNRLNFCKVIMKTRKGKFKLINNDEFEHCQRVVDQIVSCTSKAPEIVQKNVDPFF